MPLTEFQIIASCFRDLCSRRDDTLCGIGDDAALIRPDVNTISVFTLQWHAGVDYPAEQNAGLTATQFCRELIKQCTQQAQKPAWMTLSISLPQASLDWLEAFSRGLKASLEPCGVELIGGDTTQGPEAIRAYMITTE